MEKLTVRVLQCCGKTFKNEPGYQTHMSLMHRTAEQKRQYNRKQQHKWREQHREYWREDYAKHKEHYREYAREYSWKQDGILNSQGQPFTIQDFNTLWKAQNGKCVICGVQMVQGGNSKESVAVDHDHNTGIASGLLCQTCNTGMHTFERYPDATYNYLKKAGRI